LIFKHDEVLAIIDARSPEKITELAIEFIKRRAKKVAIVCSPISTGNRKPPEENRRRAAAIMSALHRQGVTVFDQFVFLRRIEKMRGKPHYQDRAFVRKVFHLPILESGWVKTIYFTYEWRRSVGAQWYHECARRLGIEVKVVQPSHNAKIV
jgi:hypothetical protein